MIAAIARLERARLGHAPVVDRRAIADPTKPIIAHFPDQHPAKVEAERLGITPGDIIRLGPGEDLALGIRGKGNVPAARIGDVDGGQMPRCVIVEAGTGGGARLGERSH